MPAVQVLSGALEDEARGRSVFAGDLLIFRGVRPMRAFCEYVDELAREALERRDPRRAHLELGREGYASRVEALRKRVRRDPQARRLLLDGLSGAGVRVERTCWDWIYLRVLPGGEHPTGRSQRLGHHRDTWSSNVYAQTNWWAPIYPITADNTIAFYPGYWSRPIKNTSARWDLEEIRARRRAGEAVSLVPEPDEPVDTSSELRVVIEPGDLLCFSGAHLHASVPNTSPFARFSIEVRTVSVDDVLEDRGAPNVDGRAPRVALDWFRSVVDGTPLPEVVRGA
jgi:hypothetical protein